jgi:hypothetical protein
MDISPTPHRPRRWYNAIRDNEEIVRALASSKIARIVLIASAEYAYILSQSLRFGEQEQPYLYMVFQVRDRPPFIVFRF